jgi:hypothetical protein
MTTYRISPVAAVAVSVSPLRSIAACVASSKLMVVRRAQMAEPRQGLTAPLNSVS